MSMEIAGGGRVWNYRAQDNDPKAKKTVRARLWKLAALIVFPTAVITVAVPWVLKQIFPPQPTSQDPSIAGGFGDYHMATGMSGLAVLGVGVFVIIMIFMVVVLYKLDVPEWFNVVSMIALGVLFLSVMSMGNFFSNHNISSSERSSAYEASFDKWANEQYGYTDLKSTGDKFEGKDKDGNAVSVYSFKMNNNTYLYENIDQLRLTLDKIEAAK